MAGWRKRVGIFGREQTIERCVSTRPCKAAQEGVLAMGTPTLLDAGVLAPAAILGLLGVWLGFGRSLVAWPMRWLIPLFGGCAAALPAILYLAGNGAAAELLSLSGTAATAAVGAISFVVTVVLLAMFMDNLRERMTVWTGSRRIGLTERVIGAFFGIACGLLLVAVAYLPMPRVLGGEPAWARGSVVLPYFRSAAETAYAARCMVLPCRLEGRPLPEQRRVQ
jgi:uncharacterized membrane protein required for colicin V production